MPVTITSADLTKGGAVMETSGGTKYAVFVDSNVLVVYKNIDGTPSLADSDTAATIHGGGNLVWVHAAIDSADDIHLVSICDADQTRDVAYAIFDCGTDTIGDWEEAIANVETMVPTNYPSCHIAIDSADKPHVATAIIVKYKGTPWDYVQYANKTGASWSTPEDVNTNPASNHGWPLIAVDSSDDVHVMYRRGAYTAYRKRTSGSWGSEVLGALNSSWDGFSLAVTGGTPYFSHGDASGNLYEGTDLTATGDTGYDTQDVEQMTNHDLCLIDSTRYLFYIDTGEDVHLISNDGGGWTDEGDLQTGSYDDVICDWCFNNRNQSGEIDYLYSDGSNVYYDAFALEAGIEISVSDSIGISDTPGELLPWLVRSRADAVTIADVITLLLPELYLPVSDSVTVAEAITLLLPELYASLSDGITVGDAAALVFSWAISAADGITVEDTAALLLPELHVDVSDGLTVGEVATLLIDRLHLSVADAVTVAETVALLLPVLQANISDAVTLGDAVALLLPQLLTSQADSISVGDTPIVQVEVEGILQINVSDGITVSDSPALHIPMLFLIRSEAVAVGDAVSLLLPELFTALSDAVALSDAATVQSEVVEELSVDVGDSVGISDSAGLSLPTLFLSRSDSISISDAASLSTLLLAIQVSDTIIVTDSVTFFVGLVVAIVALTVKARSRDLTLQTRLPDLTLVTRETSLTIKETR